MADLVIYGSPLSPFARKVQAVMHEKGLDYDFENVSIMPMPDWFKEISPARRIPVLRDRSVGAEGVAGTIADSSAICAFLEKKAPSPALYPADPFEHGRAIWIEEYCDSEVAALGGGGIFRPIVFPRFQGKPSDVETARTTYRDKLSEKLDYLEATLGDALYFCGDALSIADISVAAQIAQVAIVAGPIDSSRWPHLAAHYDRTSELPGMKTNLTACESILGKLLEDGKVDLTS